MNKKIYLMLLLLMGLMLVHCEKTPNSPESNDPPPAELTPVQKQVVDAGNEFGFKLFQKIVETNPNQNIFISPLSVSMALGMTLNGANGETYTAMQKTLELSGLNNEQINQSYQILLAALSHADPKVQFQIANSIWYRLGLNFEQNFINLNQTYFDAEVVGLDFNLPSAAPTINQWVESKTNGKIKDIVASPINPEDVMFLINAIYFKGIWKYQFQEAQTLDSWFYPTGEERVPCKLMTQKSRFAYLENDDFQAIELPYGDGTYRMAIILPHWSKRVDEMIAQLNPQTWADLRTQFKEDSVNLYLPRFKMEYEIKLNDVLTAMGMGVAFSGQADFTKMYAPGNLFISLVKHKSYLEVNEEGTEAAAATVVVISFTSTNPQRKEIIMRIDHPFLFLIYDTQAEATLFIGKIAKIE